MIQDMCMLLVWPLFRFSLYNLNITYMSSLWRGIIHDPTLTRVKNRYQRRISWLHQFSLLFYFPNTSSSDIALVEVLYPSDPTKETPFDTGNNNTLIPQYESLSAFQGNAVRENSFACICPCWFPTECRYFRHLVDSSSSIVLPFRTHGRIVSDSSYPSSSLDVLLCDAVTKCDKLTSTLGAVSYFTLNFTLFSSHLALWRWYGTFIR